MASSTTSAAMAHRARHHAPHRVASSARRVASHRGGGGARVARVVVSRSRVGYPNRGASRAVCGGTARAGDDAARARGGARTARALGVERGGVEGHRAGTGRWVVGRRGRDVGVSSAGGDDVATLDSRKELGALVAFCTPLLASNVISPLLTMTDTAFVGRCAGEASATALAALGVSTPLTDYSVTLFAFITAGLTSIVSRGVASGENAEAMNGKVYGAFFMAFLGSLAVATLLLTRTDYLLGLLNVSGDVKAIAAQYTQVRGLGMPAAFLTSAGYATLVARKDTLRPLLCVCLAAVVNFVGDWFMVSVMKTGAVGAAWATTASLYTGLFAILVLLKRQGLLEFPPKQNFNAGVGAVAWMRAAIPTKEQLAPVMAFFGPITFLVAALLTIYTTQILAANALGVTVSAAHRIAANLFSFTILCGDPLIQAGQAFLPEHIFKPKKANARKMASILFQFGLFTASISTTAFAFCCYFGAAVFTTDAAVVAQLHTVVLPMCATVVVNILSKSLYGVMVACRALNFLAGLTGVGLLGFAGSMAYLNAHVFGLAKYTYIWWITFGYYGIAVLVLYCRIKGIGFKGLLGDNDKIYE